MKAYQYFSEKKRIRIVKQMLRSGTAIGAQILPKPTAQFQTLIFLEQNISRIANVFETNISSKIPDTSLIKHFKDSMMTLTNWQKCFSILLHRVIVIVNS